MLTVRVGISPPKGHLQYVTESKSETRSNIILFFIERWMVATDRLSFRCRKVWKDTKDHNYRLLSFHARAPYVPALSSAMRLSVSASIGTAASDMMMMMVVLLLIQLVC